MIKRNLLQIAFVLSLSWGAVVASAATGDDASIRKATEARPANSPATRPTSEQRFSVVSRINCGGDKVQGYVADSGFEGGHAYFGGEPISLQGVALPAPEEVYKSNRWGEGTLTYTFRGLDSGQKYLVRLHFAEVFQTTDGGRFEDVSINGTVKIAKLNVFAAAGGANKALVKQIEVSPGNGGTLTILFKASEGAKAPYPIINGIELLKRL